MNKLQAEFLRLRRWYPGEAKIKNTRKLLIYPGTGSTIASVSRAKNVGELWTPPPWRSVRMVQFSAPIVTCESLVPPSDSLTRTKPRNTLRPHCARWPQMGGRLPVPAVTAEFIPTRSFTLVAAPTTRGVPSAPPASGSSTSTPSMTAETKIFIARAATPGSLVRQDSVE